MRLIKGTEVAALMNGWMKAEIENSDCPAPQLAIVRVGENPDELSYERGAVKRMQKIGLRCGTFAFPEEISEEEFLSEFKKINENDDISGVLLLKPLPAQIDDRKAADCIDPEKDLDGISPANMAKIYAGDDTGFAPCTAEAVIETLDYAKVPLSGRRVALIGRSLIVGKPLFHLLLQHNATVTVIHTKTVHPEEICKEADVVIAAAGKAHLVNADYVKEGAVVIDVGVNVDPETGKMVGDVDLASLGDLPEAATPVPGGVGSVTTSVLASHLIRAAKQQGKF